MRISIKRGSLTSKLHATYASTGRVACRNNLELHGSSYLPSTGSDDWDSLIRYRLVYVS